jgi:serine/threonine protein phosphatase PrpC
MFFFRLYVANVGDSRAVLFRKDKPIRMTVDHKPRFEEERIKSIEGGCVTGEGGGRVNGQLAVSRSLGDFYMHPYVIYEPHTFVTDLTAVSLHFVYSASCENAVLQM